jgi:hypothetical protein
MADGDGFTHKLFSSYVGGLRPLKILLKYDNVTYYQPRRPAVRSLLVQP